MKSNSAELSAILSNDSLGLFVLSKFDFESTYYLTTFPYDITWDGNLYVASGSLLEYSPPRYSTAVDSESYKIKLSAISGALSSEIANGVIGSDVDIHLGFTVDGVPQLGQDQNIYSYSGIVRSVQKEVGEENTDKYWLLECSSPMGDLDATATFLTSRSGMDQRNIADTSFDAVYEGSDEINLKWGRI